MTKSDTFGRASGDGCPAVHVSSACDNGKDRAMGTEKVSVTGHITKVLTINLDMPVELGAALDDARRPNLDKFDPITEVIITIAGVRIGKVNMHSREWDRRGLVQPRMEQY